MGADTSFTSHGTPHEDTNYVVDGGTHVESTCNCVPEDSIDGDNSETEVRKLHSLANGNAVSLPEMKNSTNDA